MLFAVVGLVPPGAAATGPVDFDFNGDGFSDMAVGVPFEDVGGVPIVDAGAMQVLYGSPGGFDGTDQFFHQNSPGMADAAEEADQFGFSSDIGDFNGDGLADVSVGVPGESVEGAANAGAVNVLYGSPEGLTATGEFFTETIIGLDPSEDGDRFGAAFGAGDLNGDGFDDLAVGAPEEDVGKVLDAGAVTVLFGSPAGLTSEGAQHLTQNELGSSDGAEAGDHFGQAFAPYEPNFDGDAFDDLAVGAPDEDLGGLADVGVVAVLYGSKKGPDPFANQFWDQRPTDDPEEGDRFGASIAACDFDGNGADDMAAGAPGEDVSKKAPDAGAVGVLYGEVDTGLTELGAEFFHQDSVGIADAAEARDQFAYDVAVGDVDGDGFDDLAVGTPQEEIALLAAAGAVNVLYGTAAGLSSEGDQFWHQNSRGILDRAEEGDRFGYALAIGDFNGDGVDDLGVGASFEDVRKIVEAGAGNEIYGVLGVGLTAEGDQFLHQNRPGILDKAEPFDCWACDVVP